MLKFACVSLIPDAYRDQVGAGPTALVLALTLVQNGVSGIRIVEKLDKPSDAQRGPAAQVDCLCIPYTVILSVSFF